MRFSMLLRATRRVLDARAGAAADAADAADAKPLPVLTSPARTHPTKTAELRAEVRREFEAARAASQRRKHEQQQRQSQPPQQQGGEGGGTAGSSSDADPRGARRRAPLPPPLAPASDDDAYATKKALSDGREALKRLRDMIELRR